MSFQERAWSPAFFILNIFISHDFPENVIETLQVVQKIWRFFLSLLTIFINSLDFFTFPCYKKKLMTSIYNRYLTTAQSYIDIGVVLLEIWRGSPKKGWVDPPEKTIFKKPSLIRVNFLFQTEVSFEKPYALNVRSFFLKYRIYRIYLLWYDSIIKVCEQMLCLI